MSVEATTRDIDFLKQRFYAEYGCDTNDILTLYSFWHQNFQSFVQVGAGGAATNGNQTTAINAATAGRLGFIDLLYTVRESHSFDDTHDEQGSLARLGLGATPRDPIVAGVCPSSVDRKPYP